MGAILVDTESNNAKLYIGLLGSTSTASSTYYLTPTEAYSIIKAYYRKPSFGGSHDMGGYIR